MEITIRQIRTDLYAVEIRWPDGSPEVLSTSHTEQDARVYAQGVQMGFDVARRSLGSGVRVRSMVESVNG